MIIITTCSFWHERLTPLWLTLRATGCSSKLIVISETMDPRHPMDKNTKIVKVEAIRNGSFEWRITQRFSWIRRVLSTLDDQDVLIVDAFDVAFQSDPNALFPVDGLHFAEEAGVIADDNTNSRWIKQAYGITGLQQVGHHKILCAGVAWGDRKALELWCSAVEQSPTDCQGTTNYLTYTKKLPSVIHANGWPVFHVGCVFGPQYDLSGPLVKTVNGHMPIILHQYERPLHVDPGYVPMKNHVMARINKLANKPSNDRSFWPLESLAKQTI